MHPLDRPLRAGRKILYKHRTSSPFLSGDLFASEADVSVFDDRNSPSNPSKKTVSNAKVIYCKSDRVEEFFSDYRGNINASILMFGNSAQNFYSFDHKLPNSVKMVFLQNMGFKDRKFSLLPVGLENLRHAKNGLPKFFTPKNAHGEKKSQILIGPFGNTHLERHELDYLKFHDGPWNFQEDRLIPKAFAALASRYRFVASPTGRGIDTHRFWESIYHGSIPIVKKSDWSENLSYLDIPYIEIEAWDLESLKRIVNTDTVMTFNPRNVADIWWSTWESRLHTFL
jgi:hypothetical protein